MKREKKCAALPAPPNLSAELAGYEWARDTVGESGGAVYRLPGQTAWQVMQARIDAGLVDEIGFDEARAGWAAGQAWSALQALLPLAPGPAVTDGDYSLDSEFGASLRERFLTQYGITEPDQGKLEFHLLLDELF